MMRASNWTETDTIRAKAIWVEYQREHDVSSRVGQTVGIDPGSGRLWFGECIEEVIAKKEAEGNEAPLFFARVGSEAYWRKGGRR